jgi:hypothetical protein
MASWSSKLCRTSWMAVPAVFMLTAAAHPRTGEAAASSRLLIAGADPASPATYADPTGDSGTAPDITSVVVSCDAGSQITFRVNVVKLALPSDARVVIAIDSDRNAATGYGGFDYMFLADLSRGDFVVARWNGSDFAFTTMASATATTDSGGVSFSVNAREFATTTGFRFFARTVAGSRVAEGHYDDAPDNGDWSYQLDGASTLTLTAEDPITTKTRAGKRFIAFISVIRSDGEQAEVTYGDVSCSATVAGRSLRATAIPTYGPAAGCSWRVPRHSNGNTLHAAVIVTLDGATVTQTFTARIK